MPVNDLASFDILTVKAGVVGGTTTTNPPLTTWAEAVGKLWLAPVPRVIVATNGGASFVVVSGVNATLTPLPAADQQRRSSEVFRFRDDPEAPAILPPPGARWVPAYDSWFGARIPAWTRPAPGTDPNDVTSDATAYAFRYDNDGSDAADAWECYVVRTENVTSVVFLQADGAGFARAPPEVGRHRWTVQGTGTTTLAATQPIDLGLRDGDRIRTAGKVIVPVSNGGTGFRNGLVVHRCTGDTPLMFDGENGFRRGAYGYLLQLPSAQDTAKLCRLVGQDYGHFVFLGTYYDKNLLEGDRPMPETVDVASEAGRRVFECGRAAAVRNRRFFSVQAGNDCRLGDDLARATRDGAIPTDKFGDQQYARTADAQGLNTGGHRALALYRRADQLAYRNRRLQGTNWAEADDRIIRDYGCWEDKGGDQRMFGELIERVPRNGAVRRCARIAARAGAQTFGVQGGNTNATEKQCYIDRDGRTSRVAMHKRGAHAECEGSAAQDPETLEATTNAPLGLGGNWHMQVYEMGTDFFDAVWSAASGAQSYSTPWGPVNFLGCFDKAVAKRTAAQRDLYLLDMSVEDRLRAAAWTAIGPMVGLDDDDIFVANGIDDLVSDRRRLRPTGCGKSDAAGRPQGRNALAVYEIPANTLASMRTGLLVRPVGSNWPNLLASDANGPRLRDYGCYLDKNGIGERVMEKLANVPFADAVFQCAARVALAGGHVFGLQRGNDAPDRMKECWIRRDGKQAAAMRWGQTTHTASQCTAGRSIDQQSKNGDTNQPLGTGGDMTMHVYEMDSRLQSMVVDQANMPPPPVERELLGVIDNLTGQTVKVKLHGTFANLQLDGQSNMQAAVMDTVPLNNTHLKLVDRDSAKQVVDRLRIAAYRQPGNQRARNLYVGLNDDDIYISFSLTGILKSRVSVLSRPATRTDNKGLPMGASGTVTLYELYMGTAQTLREGRTYHPQNWPGTGKIRDFGCYKDSTDNFNNNRALPTRLENVPRNGAVRRCAQLAAVRGFQMFGLQNNSDPPVGTMKDCWGDADADGERAMRNGPGDRVQCSAGHGHDPTARDADGQMMGTGGNLTLHLYEMDTTLRADMANEANAPPPTTEATLEGVIDNVNKQTVGVRIHGTFSNKLLNGSSNMQPFVTTTVPTSGNSFLFLQDIDGSKQVVDRLRIAAYRQPTTHRGQSLYVGLNDDDIYVSLTLAGILQSRGSLLSKPATRFDTKSLPMGASGTVTLYEVYQRTAQTLREGRTYHPQNWPGTGNIRDFGCYKDSTDNFNNNRALPTRLENVPRNGAVRRCAQLAAVRGFQMFGLQNNSDPPVGTMKDCWGDADADGVRAMRNGPGDRVQCSAGHGHDPTAKDADGQMMGTGGNLTLHLYEMDTTLRADMANEANAPPPTSEVTLDGVLDNLTNQAVQVKLHGTFTTRLPDNTSNLRSSVNNAVPTTGNTHLRIEDTDASKQVVDRLRLAAHRQPGSQQASNLFVGLNDNDIYIALSADSILVSRAATLVRSAGRTDNKGLPMGKNQTVTLYEVYMGTAQTLRQGRRYKPQNWPGDATLVIEDHGCYRDSTDNFGNDRAFDVRLNDLPNDGALRKCALQAAARNSRVFGLQTNTDTANYRDCWMQSGSDTNRTMRNGPSTNCPTGVDPQALNNNGQRMGTGGPLAVSVYRMPDPLYGAMVDEANQPIPYTLSGNRGLVFLRGIFLLRRDSNAAWNNLRMERVKQQTVLAGTGITVEQRLEWAASTNKGRIVGLNDDDVYVIDSFDDFIVDRKLRIQEVVKQDGRGWPMGQDSVAVYEMSEVVRQNLVSGRTFKARNWPQGGWLRDLGLVRDKDGDRAMNTAAGTVSVVGSLYECALRAAFQGIQTFGVQKGNDAADKECFYDTNGNRGHISRHGILDVNDSDNGAGRDTLAKELSGAAMRTGGNWKMQVYEMDRELMRQMQDIAKGTREYWTDWGIVYFHGWYSQPADDYGARKRWVDGNANNQVPQRLYDAVRTETANNENWVVLNDNDIVRGNGPGALVKGDRVAFGGRTDNKGWPMGKSLNGQGAYALWEVPPSTMIRMFGGYDPNECPHLGGYALHINADAPDNDIANAESIEEAYKQCTLRPDCKGFNQAGWMKSNVSSGVRQTNLPVNHLGRTRCLWQKRFPDLVGYHPMPDRDAMGENVDIDSTHRPVDAAAALCTQDSECVAVNHAGQLKRRIDGITTKPSSEGAILYVKRFKTYPGYTTHIGVDLPGKDIENTNGNLEEAMRRCEANEQCVSFNSNGFIKHSSNPDEFRPSDSNMYTRKPNAAIQFPGYQALYHTDSPGDDLAQDTNLSQAYLKCNQRPDCRGFNSDGWMKHRVDKQQTYGPFKNYILYVKRCPTRPGYRSNYRVGAGAGDGSDDLETAPFNDPNEAERRCNRRPDCPGFTGYGVLKRSMTPQYAISNDEACVYTKRCRTVNGYSVLLGRDVDGNTLQETGSIDAAETACNAATNCTGFNQNGHTKSSLGPETTAPSPNFCFYRKCPTIDGYRVLMDTDAPGNDILRVEGNPSPATTALACNRRGAECKGFNLNGFLKNKIELTEARGRDPGQCLYEKL